MKKLKFNAIVIFIFTIIILPESNPFAKGSYHFSFFNAKMSILKISTEPTIIANMEVFIDFKKNDILNYFSKKDKTVEIALNDDNVETLTVYDTNPKIAKSFYIDGNNICSRCLFGTPSSDVAISIITILNEKCDAQKNFVKSNKLQNLWTMKILENTYTWSYHFDNESEFYFFNCDKYK
ncbi:MAG TPA: hypothetical protein PKK00_00005 [Bacteroidales bacterium]|nr:hypothetical protein [Bacteroidales bacterium]HPS16301.1 hypothetical protein [Bacteroidales bacterium]